MNIVTKARLIYFLVILSLVAFFLAKMVPLGQSDGATFS